MAKKRRGSNKTAAITEYLKAHPEQGPSAVAAALNEQGLKVTAQYVSTIKSKLGLGDGSRGRKRAKGQRRGRQPSVARATRSVSYESLMEARAFVRSVGGVDKARQALEAYAELQ